jgi:RNA-binding protein
VRLDCTRSCRVKGKRHAPFADILFSMTKLTSKQRAFLRKLAHRLKPLVHIGTGGVTGALVNSVVEALNTRELIKVKILETAPENAKKTAEQLTSAIPDTHVAQTIGRTIVLYREHPEKPEIKLPKAGADAGGSR